MGKHYRLVRSSLIYRLFWSHKTIRFWCQRAIQLQIELEQAKETITMYLAICQKHEAEIARLHIVYSVGKDKQND